MLDQADRLRKLVLEGNLADTPSLHGLGPRVVVVTGGKGGVGTTTLAVNLAVALACDGRRTVLVDADFDSADAASLLHVDDTTNVADVLSGRRNVHEALVRGPAGLQVLPGFWAPGRRIECTPAAQERLLMQLARLGPHADYVVLDTGNRPDRIVERFWQAADRVLLVTTPESVSILDGYAAIKTLAVRRSSLSVYTLVNQAGNSRTAAEAHQRLARACRRFLGMQLCALGFIPADPQVPLASGCRQPLLLEFPQGPAARHIERVAQALIATMHATESIRKNNSNNLVRNADKHGESA